MLRGDGVFEVVRLYAGRPFALDDHLERMGRSAANLRLPIDLELLRADLDALLGAGDAGDAKVRLLVTRGGRRILLLEPLPEQRDSITLGQVTCAPTRLLDGIKSLSYGANMLASRLAAERGFDEALLTTPHGRLLEGPTQAFFLVVGGELCTPPLSDHVLDSITRRRIVEVTGAVERPLAGDELARAEEAFLASTTQEVLPVRAIEDHAFAVPGPVTRDAAAKLRARIDSELAAAVRG